MTQDIQYADATPGTEIIESYRNADVGWVSFFCELIDNSFDQHAEWVTIRWGPQCKTIQVDDDGDGCDNIEAMFRLGKSHRTSSTRSGRYGVGLKVAAIWVADIIKIDTSRDGRRLLSTVDWNEIRRTGEWRIAYRPDDAVGRGTCITFGELRKKMNRPLQSLADELSFTFSPALRSGKIIDLHRKGENIPLKPWSQPPLETEHLAEFDIDGRPARVRFGTVASDQRNPKDGFVIVNSFRVVERTKAPAADMRLSTSRFSALVELLEPGNIRWPLSTLKDGIEEGVRDELIAKLAEVCGDAMNEASERSVEIGLGDLNGRVADMLASLTGPKNQKAKRRSTDNPGTGAKRPTGNGSPHARAERRQRGKTIREEWRGLQYNLGDCEDRFADVDVESAIVTLGREHPAVTRLLETQDPVLIAQAVVREYAYHVFQPGMGKTLDMFGGLESRDTRIGAWLREVEDAAK